MSSAHPPEKQRFMARLMPTMSSAPPKPPPMPDIIEYCIQTPRPVESTTNPHVAKSMAGTRRGVSACQSKTRIAQPRVIVEKSMPPICTAKVSGR